MYCIDRKMRTQELAPRVRASLMNGLSGIKNATLIATKSENGVSNVTVFSSVFHLGADPALMGLIFRPVPGHTLNNIKALKKFTLNHLPSSFSESIHQSSARYEDSEFNECGLSEEFLADFPVPFVQEALIKWSMNFVRLIDIPENGTHMMIAEVEDIYLAEQSFMREDGSLNISEHVCGVIGLDSYHGIQPGKRFSYAKPESKVETLKD